jgi:hypothetical protein
VSVAEKAPKLVPSAAIVPRWAGNVATSLAFATSREANMLPARPKITALFRMRSAVSKIFQAKSRGLVADVC